MASRPSRFVFRSTALPVRSTDDRGTPPMSPNVV
jgi:hypothetical protein